jgi:hypothetical protein
MSLYSGKHCSLSACPGWDSTVRSRSGFCLISSPPSSVAQFSAGLPAFRLVSVAADGINAARIGRTKNQQLARSAPKCDGIPQMPCPTRLSSDTATLRHTR